MMVPAGKVNITSLPVIVTVDPGAGLRVWATQGLASVAEVSTTKLERERGCFAVKSSP